MKKAPINVYKELFPAMKKKMQEHEFSTSKYYIRLGIEDGKKTIYPILKDKENGEVTDTDIMNIDSETAVCLVIDSAQIRLYEGTVIGPTDAFMEIFENSLITRKSRDSFKKQYAESANVPITTVDFCAEHNIAHPKSFGCPQCNENSLKQAEKLKNTVS